MAEPVRTSHTLSFTLNSDGRSHPLMNALSIFVLVMGFVALGFGIAIIASTHRSPGPGVAIPAGVTGLISLFVGLYAQMMSETREERVLIVTGIIVGFIGLAMGLSHGAFGG